MTGTRGRGLPAPTRLQSSELSVFGEGPCPVTGLCHWRRDRDAGDACEVITFRPIGLPESIDQRGE
jgi:hypothetical protein